MKNNSKNKSLKNELAWEKTGGIHFKNNHPEWIKKFKSPSFSSLDKMQKSALEDLGIKNKDVAHLACNNGRELISIQRMGANKCIGFDFSGEFIEQARELSQIANAQCEFIKDDILNIDQKYSEYFDIVIITTGTLVWIDDLTKLFNNVNKILKRGGAVFINELHPLLLTLEPSPNKQSLTITRSYFSDKSLTDYGSMCYLGKEYKDVGIHYIYPYTISSLINCLIKNQLNIKKFLELSQDNSVSYGRYENNKISFPMSYLLIGQKH